MKPLYNAALISVLSLSGCAATGAPDYVAESYSPDQTLHQSGRDVLNARISYYAGAYNVPESLVHAVVQRESKYNPSLKHGPFWGLMQIRHDTARSMGYSGAPNGLLDPETNLTYAVAYLANAYRIAGGDEHKAIRLYAGGYYYEAKRRGLLGKIRSTRDFPEVVASSTEIPSEK